MEVELNKLEEEEADPGRDSEITYLSARVSNRMKPNCGLTSFASADVFRARKRASLSSLRLCYNSIAL